jgi:hypothetical protein
VAQPAASNSTCTTNNHAMENGALSI